MEEGGAEVGVGFAAGLGWPAGDEVSDEVNDLVEPFGISGYYLGMSVYQVMEAVEGAHASGSSLRSRPERKAKRVTPSVPLKDETRPRTSSSILAISFGFSSGRGDCCWSQAQAMEKTSKTMGREGAISIKGLRSARFIRAEAPSG